VHPSVLTDSLRGQPQLRVVSALLSLSPGLMESLLGSFLEAVQGTSRVRKQSSGLQCGLRAAEAVALVLSALHLHPQLSWQLATPCLQQWEGAILAELERASDSGAPESSVLPSLVHHLRLCMGAGGRE